MGTSYKVILYGQEIQTSKQEIHDIFEDVNQEIHPVPLIVGTFTKPIKTNRKVPIIIKLRLDM